jgi:hypothetical protein
MFISVQEIILVVHTTYMNSINYGKKIVFFSFSITFSFSYFTSRPSPFVHYLRCTNCARPCRHMIVPNNMVHMVMLLTCIRDVHFRVSDRDAVYPDQGFSGFRSHFRKTLLTLSHDTSLQNSVKIITRRYRLQFTNRVVK